MFSRLLANLSITLAASIVFASPIRKTQDATNEDFPEPLVDPFYVIPSDISSYSNGAIIRSRKVVTNLDLVQLSASYQVLYKSHDTKFRPDATVATIWVPAATSNPPKLLSFQSHEDAASLSCAPSWSFVKGSQSVDSGSSSLASPVYIQWALSQGYYVVASDHEGSQSAFLSGHQAGMATMDGIKATLNQLGLAKNTPVVLFGYSGGAFATAWAANLAAEYAPSVNIVGAVHGGTPIDTENSFKYLDGGLFAGFAGSGLTGLMNGYPEFNDYILKISNEAGKAKFAQYRSKDYCFDDIITKSVFVKFVDYLQVSDPVNQPIVKAVLARESLLMDVNPVNVSIPKFPRLIYHALEDEVVPYNDVQTFVQQQCAHGAKIQFQTLYVAEHLTGEMLGLVGALFFIRQVFDGEAPQATCGSGLLNIPSILSQESKYLLGDAAFALLESLQGAKTVFGETVDLFKKII